MLFNAIDNFIEVYNNSVIELIQCFGTSFFGQIDHLTSSVIKFRPQNSVPKHCIRSLTYKQVCGARRWKRIFPKKTKRSVKAGRFFSWRSEISGHFHHFTWKWAPMSFHIDMIKMFMTKINNQ